MKTAFKIYIKAVGIYALLTLPLIVTFFIYFISIFYVAIYGWFAWGLFSMIYMLTDQLRLNYPTKMLVLTIGTIVSVGFAYQLLEWLHVEDDVWQSEFILLPVAAIIAGWISLFIERKNVKADCPGYTETENDLAGDNSIFKTGE